MVFPLAQKLQARYRVVGLLLVGTIEVPWEDLASLAPNSVSSVSSACMLEAISEGSPDYGTPESAHWLAHTNPVPTPANHHQRNLSHPQPPSASPILLTSGERWG
jgi:hypothetical protein